MLIKAAADATAAAEEAQKKNDALKASRDRRKQSRKAQQKALAQGLAPGEEGARRLALANEQRSDAQARVDATAQALNASSSGVDGSSNHNQNDAIPGPDDDEWDLGTILDAHDASFQATLDGTFGNNATAVAGAATGGAAGFGTPALDTTANSTVRLQLESDPSQAPSTQQRRSANVVRARLLEMWSRPRHLAKLRPRPEKLARHLLDK